MIQLFKNIAMGYKNSSLQNKLFLSYFVLIFLPLVVLSLFSYQKSSDVIISQTMDISSLYLSQATQKLSSELEKMATLAQIISQNSVIRDFLEKKGHIGSFSEEFDASKEILETTADICSLYEIEEIRIYISSGFMHSRSKYVLYNLDDVKNEPWYKDMVDRHISTIVRNPYTFKYPLVDERKIMSVTTLVRSYTNIEDIIGVVSIDISTEKVAELIKSADFTKNGAVLLVDKAGSLIVDHNNTSTDLYDYTSLFEDVSKKFPAEMGITNDGRTAAGISKPILDGLRIFSVTSMESLLVENLKLRWQLILFAILLGIIVYFMAYFYSRFYTKRVKDLALLMRKTEKGNFDVKCIIDSSDEIGDLQSSFNFMTQHIHDLLNERYNLGKSLKDTELKALQAQINPHFLYNTLDLISWKAKRANQEEISDIVCKMANFYQISLSNGSDFIKLSAEFEHIKLYVQLQNLRFEKRIELVTVLQPELKDTLIMKLLLQPIVENALSHGIMDLDGERAGVIKIKAYTENGYINIAISDNGVGMNKKRLVEILSHDRSSLLAQNVHGFGLFNIIDRLKLYYNNDYSFDIDSVPGQGTTVSIKIPFSSS